MQKTHKSEAAPLQERRPQTHVDMVPRADASGHLDPLAGRICAALAARDALVAAADRWLARETRAALLGELADVVDDAQLLARLRAARTSTLWRAVERLRRPADERAA